MGGKAKKQETFFESTFRLWIAASASLTSPSSRNRFFTPKHLSWAESTKADDSFANLDEVNDQLEAACDSTKEP